VTNTHYHPAVQYTVIYPILTLYQVTNTHYHPAVQYTVIYPILTLYQVTNTHYHPAVQYTVIYPILTLYQMCLMMKKSDTYTPLFSLPSFHKFCRVCSTT
ncbi:unnamed protein product, partial [Coregonus sp. 'balchen']